MDHRTRQQIVASRPWPVIVVPAAARRHSATACPRASSRRSPRPPRARPVDRPTAPCWSTVAPVSAARSGNRRPACASRNPANRRPPGRPRSLRRRRGGAAPAQSARSWAACRTLRRTRQRRNITA